MSSALAGVGRSLLQHKGTGFPKHQQLRAGLEHFGIGSQLWDHGGCRSKAAP